MFQNVKWNKNMVKALSKTFRQFYLFFKRFYLFILRERGKQEERKGEKHSSVGSCMCPDLSTELTTQACAPAGNGTGYPVLCRRRPHQLDHTGQGHLGSFKKHLSGSDDVEKYSNFT